MGRKPPDEAEAHRTNVKGIPCLDVPVTRMRQVFMRLISALIGPCVIMLLVTSCASPPPVVGNPAQEAARRDLNVLNARVIHAYQEREEARKRVESVKGKLARRGGSSKEQAGYQADLEEAQALLQASSARVAELEAELEEERLRYQAIYGSGSRAAGVDGRPPQAGPPRPIR